MYIHCAYDVVYVLSIAGVYIRVKDYRMLA